MADIHCAMRKQGLLGISREKRFFATSLLGEEIRLVKGFRHQEFAEFSVRNCVLISRHTQTALDSQYENSN